MTSPRADQKKTKVLFVCVGNTCRSQIAEALARVKGPDVIEPWSAGLAPFGEIVEPTRKVLAERGVAIEGQFSKALRRDDCDAADLIINMTGRTWPIIFGASSVKVEVWRVSDPYGEDLDVYRRIRDELDQRLSVLITRLRKEQAQPKQPKQPKQPEPAT